MVWGCHVTGSSFFVLFCFFIPELGTVLWECEVFSALLAETADWKLLVFWDADWGKVPRFDGCYCQRCRLQSETDFKSFVKLWFVLVLFQSCKFITYKLVFSLIKSLDFSSNLKFMNVYLLKFTHLGSYALTFIDSNLSP